jgi:hypothetical protein
MTPQELLAAARRLQASEIGLPPRLWGRATAVVIRQALEANLTAILSQRRPGSHLANFRVQLLCLAESLPNKDLARRVAFTWAALSHALHHNGYELSPVASELAAWMEVVEDFIREDLP